jgi:hypothetical protein
LVISGSIGYFQSQVMGDDPQFGYLFPPKAIQAAHPLEIAKRRMVVGILAGSKASFGFA